MNQVWNLTCPNGHSYEITTDALGWLEMVIGGLNCPQCRARPTSEGTQRSVAAFYLAIMTPEALAESVGLLREVFEHYEALQKAQEKPNPATRVVAQVVRTYEPLATQPPNNVASPRNRPA